MTPERSSRIPDILRNHEADMSSQWMRLQQESVGRRRDLISDQELLAQSKEFLGLLQRAVQTGGFADVQRGVEWAPVRDMLGGVSGAAASRGSVPRRRPPSSSRSSRPLFDRIRDELGRDSSDCSRRSGGPTSCSTGWACTRPRCTRRPARR